jgi:dihydroorotase
MNTLLRSVTVLDSSSEFHGKKWDVRIGENGILEIGNELAENGDRVVEKNNLYLFPGLGELHADFSDPGNEHREDLMSGSRAALKGGFTHVALSPDTTPAVDNKGAVEYIKNKQQFAPIHLYPTGALTQGLKGEVISEMFDMKHAGARAFTDDKKGEIDSGVLRLALQYSNDIQAPVMVFPYDANLAFKGVAHEGVMSTQLGLKGIPVISEVTAIERAIRIADYCDSPIHFSYVSTAEGLNIIREAKRNGAKITCDTSMYNVLYNDSVLEQFDTRFKVLPPIRDEEQRQALLEGVIDGTIDALTTDHRPSDIESKKCEFDLAKFGSIGLTTAVAELTRVLDLDVIVERFRFMQKYLGLPTSPIDNTYSDDFVIFDADETFFADADYLPSKSHNTPILNAELTGMPIWVYAKGKVALDEMG